MAKKMQELEVPKLLAKYKAAKGDDALVKAIKSAKGQEEQSLAQDVFTEEERAFLSEEANKKLAKTLVSFYPKGHEFYANLMLKLKRIPKWELANLRYRREGLDAILEYDPVFVLNETANTLAYHIVHEASHLVLRHDERMGKKDVYVDLGTEQASANKSTIEQLEATDEVYRSADVGCDFAVNKTMHEDFKRKAAKSSLVEAHDYGINIEGSAEDLDKGVMDKYVHIKNNQDKNEPPPGGTGKLRINQHQAPVFADEMQKMVAEALTNNMIMDAADNCKDQGHIPQELMEEIRKLQRPPQVDWKAQLRNFVAAKIPAQSTKTWARLNRKFPYLLKGKRKRRVPLIAVAIDTSGSVSDRELQAFQVEIDDIRKIHKADLLYIQCDAEVNEVMTLKQKDKFPMKFKGRGGTAFRPVFEYIKEHVKRKQVPDVLIYLTDLGVCDNDFPDDMALPYGVMFAGTAKDYVERFKLTHPKYKFIFVKVPEIQ